MKTKTFHAFVIILLLSMGSCKGQKKQEYIQGKQPIVMTRHYDDSLKTIVYYDVQCDTTIFEFYPCFYLDINGDGQKDLFALTIVKSDKREMNLSDSLKAVGLQIYIHASGDTFVYKNASRNINYYGLDEKKGIKSISNSSFCVIQGVRWHDFNRYYCYFDYDKQLKNWFLTKTIVNVTDYDNKLEKETESLLEEKHYDKHSRIPFEKVDFKKVFASILERVVDPQSSIDLKYGTVYIYDKNKHMTSEFLTPKDDIYEEDSNEDSDDFIYFKQLLKDKVKYGWIKKSDIKK